MLTKRKFVYISPRVRSSDQTTRNTPATTAVHSSGLSSQPQQTTNARKVLERWCVKWSFTTEEDLTQTPSDGRADKFINLVFQFVVQRAHLLQDLQPQHNIQFSHF